MMKKIFAIALVVSVSFWAVGPVSATEMEDLQAQIDTLLETIAALQAQLAAMGGGSGSGAGCMCDFTRNLYPGMSGDDVKCLQEYLNASGHQVAASGVGSPGSETLYFGSLTRAAVKSWQDANGIEYGAYWGYFGPSTQAVYNSVCEADDDDDDDDPGFTGEGFEVGLSADTPESATLVVDSTSNDGAQALIPVLKVRFSNGTDDDVDVDSITFNRNGISADTDIAQGYLYDGDTQLAQYTSFNSGEMTFGSSGLFEVNDGKTKTLTLKIDLANGVSSGKTLSFSLDSADDIDCDAAEIEGSFPLSGSIMSTAHASDLGKLTVATSTNPSATVDPQDDYDVFNFTLASQDQNIDVESIKFTNMGSTNADDLENFRLYDGGALITTVDEASSDKTIIFDLSDDPISISKGITKTMHLKADIIGGTDRTFQMSIQEQTDVMAYDTEYGVYIKPNASGWAVQKATASTINTGKLTLNRASGSPSGNIPGGATGIVLGEWDIKATGEDVKISQLTTRIYGAGVGTTGLYQMQILFDGNQKGSTKNASTAATDVAGAAEIVTFGNTFVVPADGSTHTLKIKADTKNEAGTNLTSGAVTAKIQSTTATGRDSLASVSTVQSVGNGLTFSTGNLSAAINSGISNWSATLPTGVVGQTDALVGAFIVSGGSSEGADITALKFIDDGTLGFADLTNLEVWNGLRGVGTQIGDTQSSLTINTTYTFYPSSYINLSANAELPIYVYADIDTATTVATGGYVKISEVDGTGQTTNNSVNWTDGANGQTHWISDAGTLSVAVGDDTPTSDNVIAGSSGVTFTQTKFTAGAAEDMEVTKVVYTASLGGDAPTSSVVNVSLWNDASEQVGSTLTSLDYLGRAIFDLTSDPWLVSAGDVQNLSVKADINIIPYATSSGNVAFNVNTSSVDGSTAGITYKGAVSGSEATTTGIYAGSAMYTYYTGIVVTPTYTGTFNNYPSQYDEVFYFDVENEGTKTAYLNGVTTTFSHSKGGGTATTSAARIFSLYDYNDMSTVLATTSIETGQTVNGTSTVFTLATAEPISGGATKTFLVKGDTRFCDTGSDGALLQLYINDGADFNWDDQYSTAIETTRTFAVPIESRNSDYSS